MASVLAAVTHAPLMAIVTVLGDDWPARWRRVFPKWLIDGTRPSCAAWMLKSHVLPRIYWEAMLKGREWLARPQLVG